MITFQQFKDKTTTIQESSKPSKDFRKLANIADQAQKQLNVMIDELYNYIADNSEDEKVKALLSKDQSLWRKLQGFRGDITYARLLKAYKALM